MKSNIFFALSSFFVIAACTNNKDAEMIEQDTIQPPMAEKVPFEMTEHGNKRLDDYFWMRLSDAQKEAKTPDEQTQKVLDYLNAENAYLESKMAPHKALREKLFEEIVGRIQQKDESVPVTKNGFSYYSTFEEGDDYARYYRKKVADEKVQLLLDGPEMGKNLSYFSIGGQTVSPDNNMLVYGVDTVSRRQYVLSFKDLNTGKILSDKIINTTGYAIWANDNKTVFYTRQDEVTLRSYRIYKHIIGTPTESDELVYEEKDETFSCYVSKSKSDEYIFIESSQTLSSEVRFLSANDVNGKWKIVQPRERNHEYSVSHFGDDFYIITNDKARNFRLMKTPVNKTERTNWKEIIAHRSETFLEGIEIFKDFFVLEERTKGLTNLRIKSWTSEDEHYIEFNDPAYMAYTSSNPEYTTDVVRFGYTSLTTPNSVFDYNMKTREKQLLKQTKVLDDKFSPDNYVSERHYATARDGVQVPISLVYKKGMKSDGNNPILLYGYGSYGNNIDPYFSSVRLSLLDRGFVFAIAHIRGGQELGREWYEDGKLLKKKNTFYDFIDCGEYLIEKGFTKPAHLYAQGGSAGGLLMGAVMNMRPDLWNGVIAGVPFVDVISTMWDETIPLTTGEFDEWGNPKDKEYYDYMLSYSPYDNIEKKEYPNTLITTGYWDSQVQYWEPAKWIAKLRANKTDDNLLMMYCNMDVGHDGASGRFERYKEVALEYAFLLSLEGITK